MLSRHARSVFASSERVILSAIIAVLLSLCLPAEAAAQLMINKGATIVTKTGSMVQVNGAYQNSTGSIDDSGIVTITTDFTNNSTATAGGSGWYNIGGNYTNDGTFVRKTGTVNLNGASNQNVGGAVTTTFYDLQFTGGGSKTLTHKEIVDSNAYFTNGACFTTQTNVLNFTINGNWVNNAGLPVAPAASYVDGPCEKDMNSTNRFWFPVGKSGRGNTCSITPQSSTATTYRTQYFNLGYSNVSSMQPPLMSVSKIQYWHGDIVSGGADAIMRLYWIPGDYSSSIYMATISNLVVARWDTLAPISPGPTPAWMTAGVSAVSVGATFQSGWIESASVISSKYGNTTTNRPFTISSITADNSLPVEMGKFSARQVKNAILLDWNTYSEIQSLGFEIERRSEGGEPELVKSYVNDAGLLAKSQWGADYETTDAAGLTKGQYTYDLYQIDKNGIRTHVASQTVDFSQIAIPNTLAVSVYPNPAVQTAHIQIDLPQDTHVTATIYDVTGRLVEQISDDNLTAGGQVLSYDVSRLASGSYRLIVDAGADRVMRSFMVAK
jgi:hypothetical protein